MKSLRATYGFTLVELIIVLALAGLIMTLVFYGINQGLSNQRDNLRKTAAAKYLAAAVQWTSDNSGVLPTAADVNAICIKYIDANCTTASSTFKAPDGNPWTFSWGTGAPPSLALDKILISAQASCSTGSIIANSGTNTRQTALAVALTSGNYCVSN